MHNLFQLISNLPEYLLILLILWLLSFLIQLFYYLFFYSRIIFKDKNKHDIRDEPVSVIICAQNEEENLKKHLPRILTQYYPNYEVIVVDDCSTDNTEEVLKDFAKKYPNLRYTSIKKDEKFNHNKKLAIFVGILAANNEILVFTDADCYPFSQNWLKNIVCHFKKGIDAVISYGKYEKQKGILNKLIRYDTYFIGLQYLTFALSGIPYMGVGRNMSYLKSVFFKNKGFYSFCTLKSGDDDLFINKISKRKNIAVCTNYESFTVSIPRKSFIKWLYQKKRHYSTFKFYKLKHKILLFIEPLSRFFFYFSFIPIVIQIENQELMYVLLILFSLRTLITLIIHFIGTRKLKEKDLFVWFILFDIFFIFVWLLPVLFIKNRK